jgi:hypothetical protein
MSIPSLLFNPPGVAASLQTLPTQPQSIQPDLLRKLPDRAFTRDQSII